MTTVTRNIRFKVRGRTAAEWTSGNEVLLEREIGLETDTRKHKYGDGSTAWNSLPYAKASFSTADIEAALGVTSAADRVLYSTGAGAWALSPFSAFGRSLVDDADATAARSTLGLVIGTNVQAYSLNLAGFAGKSAPTGDVVGTTDTQTLTNKTITGMASLGLNLGAVTLASNLHVLSTTSAQTPLFQRQHNLDEGVLSLRIRAQRTDGAGTAVNMSDGFGPAAYFQIVDDAAVNNTLAYIAAVRAGADNTGRVEIRPFNAGTAAEGLAITNRKATVGWATAIPAGGAQGVGWCVSSTADFGVFFGSGAPTISAAKGSLYLRSDGSTTNDRMYVNTDGSTGWTAVTTAA